MRKTELLKEHTRSFIRDGREFVINYQLEKRDVSANCNQAYIIIATLTEKFPCGTTVESGTTVELMYMYPEITERIFDTVTNATEPVLPVHVPDIVRDELSTTLLAWDEYIS